MPKWFPGQVVDILWRPGQDLQRRLLLCPTTDEAYEEANGESPPRAARGNVWMAASPDGEIGPHSLAPPKVKCAIPYGRTGKRKAGSIVGKPPPAATLIYGEEWAPTPAEFVSLLERAMGVELAKVLAEAAESSAESSGEAEASSEPEEEEEEQAPAMKKAAATASAKARGRPKSGPRSGSEATPSEWSVVRRELPSAGASNEWRSLAWSDGSAGAVLPDNKVDVAFVVDGVGLAKRGDKHFVFANSAGIVDVLDARVLAVRENQVDGRHLPFRDAVGELTETAWPRFPVSGPRTALWVCQFIRDNDIAPRSRHVKWRAEVNLTASDDIVAEHEFCSRLLQTATVFDQLNIGELACMELVSRRLQMCEYKYRDRILGRIQGGEVEEDAHLYMGTGETRGMLCISPALLSHVTDEQHKEAAVMKEKRKLKEERALNRSSGGGGEGSADRSRQLQSLVDKQKAEIAKLKGGPTGGGDAAPKSAGAPRGPKDH